MKNFIIKLFLFLCAVIFISQSILLFMIRMEKISIETIIHSYSSIFQIPFWANFFNSMIGVFLGTGLILCAFIFRKKTVTEEIVIKDKGEFIRIPIETIKALIIQILGNNPRFKEIDIDIFSKGSKTHIILACAYEGSHSVKEEIIESKEILKGELKRILDLSHIHFDFQLGGITVTPQEETNEIVVKEEQDDLLKSAEEIFTSETLNLGEDQFSQDIDETDVEAIDAIEAKNAIRRNPWD